MKSSRTFVCFAIVTLFVTGTFFSEIFASDEIRNNKRLCFEVIFGSLIVEPVSEKIWYSKLSAYEESDIKFADIEHGGVPEYKSCKFIIFEYVPLFNSNDGNDERINVTSMSLTNRLVSESYVNNRLGYSNYIENLIGSKDEHGVDSYYQTFDDGRFRKLRGKIYKKILGTRYFHKHPAGPTSLFKDHLNKNSLVVDPIKGIKIAVPKIRYNVFFDSISHPDNYNEDFESIERQIGSSASGVEDAFISSYLQNPLVFSSNNCWLIQPTIELNTCGNTIPNEWVIDSNKNLTISSLVIPEHEGNHGVDICGADEYPVSNGDGSDIEKCKKVSGNLPPRFKLFDSNGNKLGEKYDSASFVGIDYDLFTNSPYELDLVYQHGFEKNSYAEKHLRGSLIYKKFRRLADISEDESIEYARDVNISRICFDNKKELGWISQPKFSRRGDLLYFTALNTIGDDSSKKDIYAIKKSLLENDEFVCSSEDLKKITGQLVFNEPIRRYSVSGDQTSMSVIFEKQGGSVVRFLKINPKNGALVSEEQYKLNWDGFIYDVVDVNARNHFDKNTTFYILASTTISQASVYRCVIIGNRIDCDEKSRVHETPREFDQIMLSYHEKKIGTGVSLARESIYSEENDLYIDTFVLQPDKPNCKAIVSIHGGPNESWDGRFARREYMLAKQGYTVYLPNPSGSTGYGFPFSKASRYSWGTTIYDDIKAVVKHVSDQDKYCNIVVKGFSFGGYMVNWIQTRPPDEIEKYFSDVDAFIALNPVFDLREFSASTDQLWFPQYQLGCSGVECLYSFPYSKTPCSIYHNPACYVSNLGKRKIIPTLFYGGCFDQRIPICANSVSMEESYIKANIPFKAIDPPAPHAFPIMEDLNMSFGIHRWISKVTSLPTRGDYSEYIDCSNPNEYFDNCKGIPQLYENCGCSPNLSMHDTHHGSFIGFRRAN